ncbi:MAG: hypothetical protein ACTSVY_09165 [Candidatus Helarchaeota archaeon]
MRLGAKRLMRLGVKKLIGLVVLLVLFNSWAFCLIQAPFGTVPYNNVNSSPDFNNGNGNSNGDLESKDNLEKSTSDIYQDLGIDESSSFIYKFKPEELQRAHDVFNFLITQAQNITDHGFWKFVNLTGGTNDTTRTTQASALSILAGIELMLTNLSNQNILNKTIEIADFMVNNLLYNVNHSDYRAFFSNISNDLTLRSSFVNVSDNALAILSLLDLYPYEKNETYLSVVNESLTFLNEVLWDDENGGYYSSNQTINGTKNVYDNLLAALANIKITLLPVDVYDYEYKINARNKAKQILNLIFTNLYNGSDIEGIAEYSNKYWNVSVNSNDTLTNSLGIHTYLTYYSSYGNDTYLSLAENISKFLDLNVFDSQRGLFNTSSLNFQKSLEANFWTVQAKMDLYGASNNLSYYVSAIQLNNNITLSFYNDTEDAYDYIIDFEGNNNTLKYARINALGIITNLQFKYLDFPLSRANLTFSILLNKYLKDNLFQEIATRGHTTIGIEYLTGNFFMISSILKLNNFLNNSNLIQQINQTYDVLYNNYYDSINNTFLTKGSSTSVSNYTSSQDNAISLLALIDMYSTLNNASINSTINSTWNGMNTTFWDVTNGGYYNYVNGSEINDEKRGLANFFAVLANLEVGNLTDMNASTRTSANNMANATLRLLVEKMWDNVSHGFYYNASADWNNQSRIHNESKNTFTNLIAILALLKYIEYFPSDQNKTDYELLINQTVQFLMDNLWDDSLFGFFQSCNETGSYLENYDKLTSTNAWAVRTFLELYDKTNNETYLTIARRTLDYINLYGWDQEFGLFFETTDRNGSITSESNTYKLTSVNALALDALIRMANIDKTLEIEPLSQVSIDEKYLNNGFKSFTANLTIYSINGTKMDDLNVTIRTSGFYKTISGINLYGLGQLYYANKSINGYNVTINVSRYQTQSFLTINLDDSRFAYKYELYSFNRLFEEYGARAFVLVNSLNLLFKNHEESSYIPYANAANNTFYVLDNLQAINAMIEYMKITGLQTAVNVSATTILSTPIDQILFTEYINKTFNFVYDNQRVNNPNVTGFVQSYNITSGYKSNVTRVIDNSYAILVSLKMYQITNNTYYLEIANETWNYINSTFWDNQTYGFRSTNATDFNASKNLEDNLYAALACLELSNVNILNETIRNQSLAMVNITLNNITTMIWDQSHGGFYSSFNGSNWIPETNSTNAKKTVSNALAINLLLKYSDLNDVNSTDYKLIANSTFDYLNTYLWDDQYFGFFHYTNDTYYENTSKYLESNAMVILALMELYNRYINYTYYQIAEQVMFYLNTFMYSSILGYGSYLNATSRYGFQNITEATPDISSFNLIIMATLKLFELRKYFNSITFSNYSISSITAGKIENKINVTFQLFDSDNNPIQNANIYGILTRDTRYYSPINITNIYANYYRVELDVGYTMDELTIKLIGFTQNHVANPGLGEYTYKREVPIYPQIAYDTMDYLITTYWKESSNGQGSFKYSPSNSNMTSFDNFLLIQSLLNINKTFGDLLYSVTEYQNDTYANYIQQIIDYQDNYLVSDSVNNTERLVTGYIQEITDSLTKSHYTRAVDNAMAVISYLELYNETGNVNYLNKANDTWIYLNYTFLDSANGGFKSYNTTESNSSRSAFDNFMVIWACLMINKTANISSNIRSNASQLALTTFNKLNSSLLDANSTFFGGFASTAHIYDEGGNWYINGTYRQSHVNALAGIVSLELYNQTKNASYYNFTKRLINLLETKFWDGNNSGYYYELLDNFTLEFDANLTQKPLESQMWGIMLYNKMFKASGFSNFSYYYRAEEILRFCNDYFINNVIYNNSLYYSGYRDRVQFENYPAGEIITYQNGLAINALIDQFQTANTTFWNESTTPWLTDNTSFKSANVIVPNGEFMNITSLILYNNSDFLNYSEVKITILGSYPTSGLPDVRLIKEFNASLDENNASFIVDLVNLTNTQDIYVSIYAVNESKPAYWKLYYVSRIRTSIEYNYLGSSFNPISPIAIKNGKQMDNLFNLWPGYILGQDRFTINVTYGSTDTDTLGYPKAIIQDARVNFEVLFPDGTIYVNRSVMTDESGIATISFGPPGIDDRFLGVYNVTITASRGEHEGVFTQFYETAETTMQLRIDYGIDVYQFVSLTNNQVAQGDLLQLNLTLTNTRKDAANITISIYGDAYNTTVLEDYTLEVGLSSVLINVRVYDTAAISSHYIWVNLTWGNTLVNYQDTSRARSYIPISIISSITSESLAIPDELSEDDTRYAIFRVKNNKLLMNNTFTIQLFSSYLEYSELIGNLTQNEYNYFYVAMTPKPNAIYSQVSGTFEIRWVNFSQTYSFNVQIKPVLEVQSITTPYTPQQNQLGYINMQIKNYRTVPIEYYIVYNLDGNVYSIKYTIDAYDTQNIKYQFNVPIEVGRHNVGISVYKYSISQENLVYNKMFQYTVDFSLEFILLVFVIPFIAIIIGVFLLLNRFHKMEEEFEKKKVQTVFDERKRKKKKK